MSERTRSVLLTLLLVLSTFSTVSVGAATATPTDSPTTYHLTQGGECYEVTAIGDGTTSVEDFYDYRSGNGTKYGSYGNESQEIQENQVSHLFVYDGSQGTSLVMLHDELNESEGGAITFNISGLPDTHQWVVEDDDYEGRDDNFNYNGTNATIDWMWAPNRTDGAAVRGLGNNFSAVTIDPAFGEESWAYQERDPQWEWATDDVSWELQSGDGTEIPLDKTQSLSISKGKCPDETNPEAALTASPNPVGNNEEVTLDASNSTDDEGGTGIAEYRWDFDGDGTIDETTTDNATISHTYTSTGSYDASVTVVDGNNNTDDANVTVEVTESDDGPSDTTDPTAALTAMPSSGSVETEFVFDANASEDDEGIAAYHWDLDGDGEFETTTESPQTSRNYSEPGPREVTVQVEDAAGNTDTASTNISVYEVKTDSIEFVNATAVEVTGEFDEVTLTMTVFNSHGMDTATHTYDGDISGTTVLTAPDEAVWGPVVQSAAAFENASDADPALTAENPDYDAQIAEVRPEEVSTFVEDARKGSNGTYEVTFGYHNPNDAAMVGAESAFASGNTSATPPEEFEPGRHTFTVTWTPDSDDSNLVWATDLSNFGYGTSTATSPTPHQIDSDEMSPAAALTAEPTTATPGEAVTFDASQSSDDHGVTAYKWDLDDDGEYEKTTDEPTITRSFSDAGTHRVAVTVADESGQTDTARESVTVSEQSSDSPPTADLQVEPTVSMSQVVTFDASKSTDDEGIVKYKWDFDGDGEIDRKTDAPVVNHYAHKVLGGPGTYEVAVIAVDDDYNGDAARRTVTVEKTDHTPPSAVVHVPETVEIGEEFEVRATDLTEGPRQLSHIRWLFETSDGMVGGANDLSTSHSFDEAGEKKVTLKLKDRAGNVEEITETVTVTAADEGEDSGGTDPGDGTNPGDGSDSDVSNPGEGGISDGDNDGSKSGGLPSESPDDTTGQQTGGNDRTDETVSAPLNDSDGRVGSVVLHSSGEADPEVEATDAAPEGVEAPAVEDDGFAALSYVTVAGADRATVTVSESRLDAPDATPDEVTLFRYENDSWTAVETAQVEATEDGYRFDANVSEGTYAVGIDRPVTSVTDVSVGSQQADPGESVTVTATVENTGRADDTHEVVLTVGGEEVSTKTVSVEAGETAEATFSVSLGSGGTYEVGVGDATAELVVQSDETTSATETERTETTTATSDGGIPGFGVGVTLVALVAAALVALRRS